MVRSCERSLSSLFSVLCLAYAFSPSVDGVENFNVKLFKEAISIVIVMTLLLQGTMTKVCSKY